MKAGDILDSMFSPGGATCTTASTGMQTATAEKMLDAMMAAMKALDESEPFFRFMAERGNSPHDGWTLCVPQSIAAMAGVLPRYVKAHKFGDSFGVIVVNTRELGRLGWHGIGDDDAMMLGVRL